MGCDIHSFAERRDSSGNWKPIQVEDTSVFVNGCAPFGFRNYTVFALLAGVRNWDAIHPIAPPRGLPADASESVRLEFERWDIDAHTPSWLTIAELATADVAKLGPVSEYFRQDLEALQSLGADRIVFWFDN